METIRIAFRIPKFIFNEYIPHDAHCANASLVKEKLAGSTTMELESKIISTKGIIIPKEKSEKTTNNKLNKKFNKMYRLK